MKADLAPAVHRAAASSAAEVEFELVDGRSVVTKWRAGNPLKLLVPRQGGLSAWVITATFGGGLLAGDEILLRVCARAGARGMIATQSSTKIYRSPAGAIAKQELSVEVEDGALLAVLPDPIVCFASARYEQKQRFDLSAGASLVLLDWFTCGRLARGERWAMNRYRTSTDIFVAGRRVVHDAMLLDSSGGAGDIAGSGAGGGAIGGANHGAIDDPFRTGRYNCFASAIVLGPLCADAAKQLIETVHARKLERRGEMLVTAGPLHGGAILRVAAVTTELATKSVRELLSFVTPLLGQSPWARKW